jgi:hypothetical protein
MAGRGDRSEMRRFVERHQLGFMPQVGDTDGSVWTRLGVAGQPAWIFVRADGRTERVYGPLPDEELQARLDALAR